MVFVRRPFGGTFFFDPYRDLRKAQKDSIFEKSPSLDT
jgi:hypothetical protein